MAPEPPPPPQLSTAADAVNDAPEPATKQGRAVNGANATVAGGEGRGGGQPARRSSLQTCPKEVPLHVHFPPESILTSVTMIPPPPEKGGPLRALRRALCGCLCRRHRDTPAATEQEPATGNGPAATEQETDTGNDPAATEQEPDNGSIPAPISAS